MLEDRQIKWNHSTGWHSSKAAPGVSDDWNEYHKSYGGLPPAAADYYLEGGRFGHWGR